VACAAARPALAGAVAGLEEEQAIGEVRGDQEAGYEWAALQRAATGRAAGRCVWGLRFARDVFPPFLRSFRGRHPVGVNFFVIAFCSQHDTRSRLVLAPGRISNRAKLLFEAPIYIVSPAFWLQAKRRSGARTEDSLMYCDGSLRSPCEISKQDI
jgi:hypothetical protein